MSRPAQEQWLRWCVASCSGDPSPPPVQTTSVATEALLYSGLTALVGGQLAIRGQAIDEPVLAAYIAEQRAEVAARYQRFVDLAPRVLGVLAAAGVVAVPLKGLAIAEQAWPRPEERPMADLDLLIAPADRAAAITALRGAGFVHHESSRAEETFLGWGDGSAQPAGAGRGESAHHNGKVELHPGWTETLHGYVVSDGDAALALARPGTLAGGVCRRFPPGILTAHALGHLSACVVRQEVRAVNVVDLYLALRELNTAERALMAAFVTTLDPRLSAPGLWLVEAVAPIRNALGFDVAAHLSRLPAAAQQQLVDADVSGVLRTAEGRPPWAWRSAWAMSTREGLAMARQFVVPPTAELRRHDPGASAARLHLGRVVRSGRRLVRRR